MEIQQDLDSDIVMAFDECVRPIHVPMTDASRSLDLYTSVGVSLQEPGGMTKRDA